MIEAKAECWRSTGAGHPKQLEVGEGREDLGGNDV